MPIFPYVAMQSGIVRSSPLGPVTLNQLQANIEAIDELFRVEHFIAGGHNALEIPWLLGRVADGATPTGTLFDTTYGGSTFTRPATGAYTVDVASGVVTSDSSSRLLYSAMANVNDSAIEAKPHTITVEAVSATSFKFRIRSLSSSLGAGDTWADVNRNFNVGIHAPAQDADVSTLAAHSDKARGSYLTEAATDWNALVGNQGIIRKAELVEHLSSGAHSANRIAKGMSIVSWSGSAYALTASAGVSSVSKISTGVVEVTMSDTYSATTLMACFPEAQPATPNELAITNGKPHSTTKFRFYTYAFDGTNWGFADRSFAAAMFGVLA